MPVLFPCPACKRAHRASRKFKGLRWRCPDCGVETLVPGGTREEESGEHAPAPIDPAALFDPARAELEAEILRTGLARVRLEEELARRDREARESEEKAEREERAEVECAACAEKIKARAKVCKHCGHIKGDRVPAPKGRKPRARRLGPAKPGKTAAVIITVLLGPALGWTYANGCSWGAVGLGVNMLIGVLAAASGHAGLAVVLGANGVCAVFSAQMCDWD